MPEPALPAAVPSEPRSDQPAPSFTGDESIRLLVDAVVDYAIFLLDSSGRVMTWNEGAQRIKGYTAAEIVGQHFSVFYTPEDREGGRPEWVLANAAQAGRFEDEGWRMRKDGSRFWADVVVTALRTQAGVLYGYAKVTRDMTERREAAIREQQLAVEREARRAAEEALASRDRFLSIASHELRTPLASVQLASEALLMAHGRGTLDPERLDASLRRITRAVDRLGVLVAELLDVSRLTSGASSLRRSRFSLPEVAMEVVDRFRAASPGRIIRTSFDSVEIEADEVRMDQVITNLVDNALKYSGDSDPIEVRVGPADGGAVVEVRDEGIGVDAVQRSHLFEPFARGDNVQHVAGMGLGLFIAHQIVAEHGGELSVKAREGGRGTLARVWLPAGPRPAERADG